MEEGKVLGKRGMKKMRLPSVHQAILRTARRLTEERGHGNTAHSDRTAAMMVS
jgi:hypothetical protein